jgi:hypothetical protein
VVQQAGAPGAPSNPSVFSNDCPDPVLDGAELVDVTAGQSLFRSD